MKISPNLNAQTFKDAPSGLSWMLSPQHGWELVQSIGEVVRQAPYFCVVILCIAVALLLLKAALKRAGDGVGRVSKDHYVLTGKALLWTLLLALPIPLLFGSIALTLPQPDASLNWQSGSLASALGCVLLPRAFSQLSLSSRAACRADWGKSISDGELKCCSGCGAAASGFLSCTFR